MPRAVVTGGAGFLGSHLCRELHRRGWDVVAIDSLLTGRRTNVEELEGSPRFSLIEHDVTKFVSVDGPVDAVLHFASPASPRDYLEYPIKTLKVGSLGTHNTLGLALAKGARYLLASTSEIYGDPLEHPQSESYWGNVNPVGPRGVYDEAKRFSEAISLAYHRSHGLDVKIVRIFNSILADEQLLYDDGESLHRETAAELAQRIGANNELRGIAVPGFDEAGSIGPRSASHFIGHPPSGRCFEVHLRYGRSIRVTGDHSLFVEGVGGVPEARVVTDLRVGDRVAIAGRLDVPERDRTCIRMSDVWDRVGLDPWSLGILAPGLGAIAWDKRRELTGIIARDRRPNGRFWKQSISSQIAQYRDRDQVPLGALRALGIPIPKGALARLRKAGWTSPLPESIEISDELLWFLGLFVAEGNWMDDRKHAFVTISGNRSIRRRAAKVMERDLGVVGTIAQSTPERSGAITFNSVSLVHLFRDLGFLTPVKGIPGWVLGLPRRRLKWFLEGYREGDGVHSGQKHEEQVRHEFSTTSSALKDDLVVAFARFGLVPSVGRYETTLKKRTGDRRYPFWRLTLAHVDPWSPLEWDESVTQRLQARRRGDIVWASVKSVDEIEPTDLVYDFCVPGIENFWAGTGVMAHNTMGPHLRSGDGRVVSNFLNQAMDGKPLTVYGDGTQTRSFCYVDDEVRGILALLDSDWIGPMNIGNPDEFSVLQLAEIVLEVTGSDSEIMFEPLPVDDPTQRQPDIGLARRVLGWEPEIDLRDALARTYDWYRMERERDGV